MTQEKSGGKKKKKKKQEAEDLELQGDDTGV